MNNKNTSVQAAIQDAYKIIDHAICTSEGYETVESEAIVSLRRDEARILLNALSKLSADRVSPPVAGEARPYCYARETRGPHGGKVDVLLDIEYNSTDNFSGGRKGGFPLYRCPAGDAQACDFAKIIRTTDGAQVLFYLDSDSDDETLLLIGKTVVDGITLKLNLGFTDNANTAESADARRQAFEHIDQAKANRIHQIAKHFAANVEQEGQE